MNGTNGATTPDEQRRRRADALRRLAADGGGTVHGAGRSRALQEALAVFGSERELLLAAHQRWQVHLLARLDQVLEEGPQDVHDGVRQAVEELGRVMPGIAALLRAHAGDPVLDAATRRLAGYVDRACPCGGPHPLVGRTTGARAGSRCLVGRARVRAARCCRRLAHRPGVGALRLS